VSLLDAVSELLFLLGREQRRLVNLAEVSLQRRLDRFTPLPVNSCHGAFPRAKNSRLFNQLNSGKGRMPDPGADNRRNQPTRRRFPDPPQPSKKGYRPPTRSI